MEDYNKVLQIQDKLNPLSKKKPKQQKYKKKEKEKKNKVKKNYHLFSIVKKWQFWIVMIGIYGLSLCGNALKITISDVELPSVAHKEIIQENFIEENLEVDIEPEIDIIIESFSNAEQNIEQIEEDIKIIKEEKSNNNFNIYNNLEQQQTEDIFVLNTNSHKIHYSNCNYVPKIAEKNYATSNDDLDTLLNQGYTTCGHCFK